MSVKFMVETKDKLRELEAEVQRLKQELHDFINEQRARETLPPAKKRDLLTLKDRIDG